MFAKFFIDRPIFATVLSLLVTLGGLVGRERLPVALYPEIAPPTVEVSGVYPGANARDVVDAVAAPIEQQVNGVEGMMYMTSTSGNDGSYALTVAFKPGTNLNVAQILVQNRVGLAERVLPDIVRRRGVTVKKKSTSRLMMINLLSPNHEHDDLYLSNYATIRLRDELARLEGVGDIRFLGQRDYSMRVWLDPDRMTARSIGSSDVVKAIEAQNAQVAAGQIGQPPAPSGQTLQYTINTPGRKQSVEEFREIVVKTDGDGRAVRLHDVADVELGAVSYDQICTLDGKPSIAVSIYQLPGTNAIETAARVRAKMEELKRKFRNENGVDYLIVYDTTPFIEESVNEVMKTLRDAVILVSLVMLLFLQSWRSAVIPLAAVPTAIIGTFGAMALFGFSLNMLTLFGLVLAVGIVVDDAIVVVEAVEHHIESGLSPRNAALKAMDEVSGPVIAVGLVLAAVFVPCLFVSGIIGQFFRQFAVTIAVSTLLSAFNSLTLSPALCALLLRPKQAGGAEPLPRLAWPVGLTLAGYFLGLSRLGADSLWGQWLLGHLPADLPLRERVIPIVCALLGLVAGMLVKSLFNRALAWGFRLFHRLFDGVIVGYVRVVRGIVRIPFPGLVVYLALLGLTYYVMAKSPVGFIPQQDKGYLLINVQLPDSASLGRTGKVVRAVEEKGRAIPGVAHTIAVAGQSELVGAGAPNFGTLYVMLDKFTERTESDRSADVIAGKLRQLFVNEVPEATIHVFGAPPVDGLGATGSLKLMLENRGDPDPRGLQEAAEQVVRESDKMPELTGSYSGFRADTPWLELVFRRDQAEAAGVPAANVLNELQTLFGSLYVNDFNRFERTWQVNLQAAAKFRERLDAPSRVRVRTRDGRFAALGSFVSLRETTGPASLVRYNLYPAAPILTNPTTGTSSGRAMDIAEQVAGEVVNSNMKMEWTESALLQRQSGDTALKALALSVILVFLVLAAQYESWTLPLAVILVVPMCLLCAAIGVNLAGHDVNVFTQVGFVVLVGLACKNAILIVEFARARHQAGVTVREAVIEACRVRLRPIIMTSAAFILGVVPLILAEGAGAEMRNLLGTAVFAGMLGVTLFGVFLTPIFFVAIQGISGRWARRRDS